MGNAGQCRRMSSVAPRRRAFSHLTTPAIDTYAGFHRPVRRLWPIGKLRHLLPFPLLAYAPPFVASMHFLFMSRHIGTSRDYSQLDRLLCVSMQSHHAKSLHGAGAHIINALPHKICCNALSDITPIHIPNQNSNHLNRTTTF